VPTAPSSTEPRTRRDRWHSTVRATADLTALVGFRAAALRGRSRPIARAGLLLILALTAVCAWLPAYLPGAGGSPGTLPVESSEVLLLLPSAYLAVLVISVISAASSGGGRELLPREQGVAFPVSPTTDHLGALLMAPLNIAWLMQGWTVLAATAFVVGPDNLPAAQLPVLVWLVVATAVGQLVAWVLEWVRRGRWGVWLVRAAAATVAGALAVLVVTDTMVAALNESPTLHVAVAVLHGSAGSWWLWSRALVVLLALGAVAVLAGAVMAHATARRSPRDELRVESSTHSRRSNPGSDLVALLRVDRAGIWRSVPLRRGFAVLSLLPGLVAVASPLEWYMLNILPGLVASGGALLFGVNSWCLDGRGTLWRDSLPVRPGLAFASRVLVLSEVLVAATLLSLVLGALRAGDPTGVQLVAVACSVVVVTLQVVSASMRWSVRRPYAVDLRSARATPAPPLTMVGYSARLAVATTVTGMLFVATSRAPDWRWPVLVALPLLLVSGFRLLRTSEAWEIPETRSRVVTTVAS
jgi:hypothetical protein